MIQVTLSRKQTHFIVSAYGHATGSPEMCAAVSCLIGTLDGWIRNAGDDAQIHKEQMGCGNAFLEWSGEASSMAVFDAVRIGFLQLELSEPSLISVIVTSE